VSDTPFNPPADLPDTLTDAVKFYANPMNCIRHVVALRWPDGIECPHCQSKREPMLLQPRRIFKCRDCRKQFSPKTGTIFEDSPLSLDKWLVTMWMVANCKNGVSSYEVHRAIGVTQKSAWFMLQRLRLAMQDEPEGQLCGIVEADETFIGGKARNMHKHVREEKITGRGPSGKTIVIGLLPNDIALVNDPLAPGVANGPFPSGTNPATGLTVQSNTLGGSAATPSPRGAGGLVTASAGYLSTPNDQISNNQPGDSFDMIFALPMGAGVRAVSFIPLFFPDTGFTTGTITIQVYGPLNVLLSSTTITGVDYVTASSFVGIVATGADTIARINLWDGSTISNYQGADNIEVYSDLDPIPEPSTFLLAGLGMLAGLFVGRRSSGPGTRKLRLSES